jgi:hypothetical protein
MSATVLCGTLNLSLMSSWVARPSLATRRRAELVHQYHCAVRPCPPGHFRIPTGPPTILRPEDCVNRTGAGCEKATAHLPSFPERKSTHKQNTFSVLARSHLNRKRKRTAKSFTYLHTGRAQSPHFMTLGEGPKAILADRQGTVGRGLGGGPRNPGRTMRTPSIGHLASTKPCAGLAFHRG